MLRQPHEMKLHYERKEKYLVSLIKDYYDKNGEWPRVQEMSSVSRMIQRNFGGMVAFRKKHNLGYENYTKGEYRSKITKELNTRGFESEDMLFDFLVEKYGRVNVHREPLIKNKSRNRADFLIYKNDKELMIIDCFYPKNVHSLRGCLHSKSVKYKDYHFSKVVFVCINPNIEQQTIDDIASNKKIPLEENQFIYSLEQFKHTQQSVV